MTYERPFERRLEDWLADGPAEAPERVIDAAVDHAYRHPRRRSFLGSLGRTLMASVHSTPVVPPSYPAWITVAASVAVVVIAGLVIVGGSGLLNQRVGNPAAAASSSPSSTAPLSSVPAAQWVPPGVPIHVTGTFDLARGLSCTPSWCEYDSILVASDARLSGPFVLDTGGGTIAGTYGTAAFFEPGTRVGYSITVSQVPEDKLTWDGEWFTAGARPVGVGPGPSPTDITPADIWPVDTIWLHGRNGNTGLTAVLRLSDQGSVDGWIFNTPASH